MLYRDYDQQGLDDQYDARKACADFEDYAQRWPEWSRRYRETRACHLDLAYGPSPAETLDIFPAEAPGAPLLAFIHGGYWRAFSKNDFSFVAEGFVASGISVAVLDYALAPAVTLDEIVRQNRAALAWLYHNAAEFGADPKRLHVSGHSAGGHLTVMLMSTDWPAFRPGLPPDLVKSGTAISGIYDLEPIRLAYVNEDVRLDEEMARRNSPTHHLPASAAPLIVGVGGDESDEFQRQAKDYGRRWRDAGLPLQEITLPRQDHFSIVEAFIDPNNALARATHERILARTDN